MLRNEKNMEYIKIIFFLEICSVEYKLISLWNKKFHKHVVLQGFFKTTALNKTVPISICTNIIESRYPNSEYVYLKQMF